MAFKILKNPLSPVLSSMLPIALLIGNGAIFYMAFAHLFGFCNDDWYLIYAGVSQGLRSSMMSLPLIAYFAAILSGGCTSLSD
jgi:hypothetical protein